MTAKQIAAALAAAAALAGTVALSVVKKDAPAETEQNCAHVSDPKTCAEWLKIKNPTPLQHRLYEDS